MKIIYNIKPIGLINEIKAAKADMSIYGYGSTGWNESYQKLKLNEYKLKAVFNSPIFKN